MAGLLRTPKNASVAKAFQILKVLASGKGDMTATDVAQSLGTNLPTVHRFLVTLEEIGVVSRSAQGRFQLGLMLANLGGKVESNKLLIDQAQSHLDRLALDFREVAHCAVRNGGVAINVALALPDRSLMIGHAAGDTVPLHCSAVGKVLLAALEHAARGRILEHLALERFTDRTLTDRAALAREVGEVAERGFAVDNEEWEEGLRSIAVPIRNGCGVTVAAIAMSAPVSRLDDVRLAEVEVALRESAERLGRGLFTESRVFPQKARPRGAFPHLKRVDDFVFISGTSARRPDDSFEGVRVNPDGSIVVDIRKQTRAVFENIRDMLADLDLGLDSLIDIQAYLTDMGDYEEFNDAYAEFFGFDGPTRTTVGVNELPHPHQKLMVRAIARAPRKIFNEDHP
jgi:DNA-binding IclR family transcriptional regulator/enamine deaminase RidA (YjgF/YER057c/UK114 family)